MLGVSVGTVVGFYLLPFESSRRDRRRLRTQDPAGSAARREGYRGQALSQSRPIRSERIAG